MHKCNLEEALEYTSKGMKVFPVHYPIGGKCSCLKPECKSNGKHPMTHTGLKEASNDLNQIKQWWISKPEANIGIATGKTSGIVVLDIDPKNGGDESFKQMIKKYGELPKTPTVITGSKGNHFYFKSPDCEIKNKANLSNYSGIDIRGDGGYIVAPPSLHASGNRYEWLEGHALGKIELADMPEWLIELTKQPNKSINQSKIIVNDNTDIPEGTRNNTLASIAGSFRQKGLGEEEIFVELQQYNRENCSPPLEDSEIRTIAHSLSKYPVNESERLPEDFHLTDVGNSKRLIFHHGHIIRYCIEDKSWLIWDKQRWIFDGSLKIMEFAKDTVNKICKEALKYAQ